MRIGAGFDHALNSVDASSNSFDVGDSQTNALYYIATLPVRAEMGVTAAGWVALAIGAVLVIGPCLVVAVVLVRRRRRSRKGYATINNSKRETGKRRKK